jgi:hypothetical protein
VANFLDQAARQRSGITAPGLEHLEKAISSLERMFEGIILVLNPGRSNINEEAVPMSWILNLFWRRTLSGPVECAAARLTSA